MRRQGILELETTGDWAPRTWSSDAAKRPAAGRNDANIPSEEEVDAYIRDGEVRRGLRDAITYEPLRDPVKLVLSEQWVNASTIRRWVRAAGGRAIEPFAKIPLTKEMVRRDHSKSAELDQVRAAAEDYYRASGDVKRAWAMRWLRRYCQSAAHRPPFDYEAERSLILYGPIMQRWHLSEPLARALVDSSLAPADRFLEQLHARGQGLVVVDGRVCITDVDPSRVEALRRARLGDRCGLAVWAALSVAAIALYVTVLPAAGGTGEILDLSLCCMLVVVGVVVGQGLSRALSDLRSSTHHPGVLGLVPLASAAIPTLSIAHAVWQIRGWASAGAVLGLAIGVTGEPHVSRAIRHRGQEQFDACLNAIRLLVVSRALQEQSQSRRDDSAR